MTEAAVDDPSWLTDTLADQVAVAVMDQQAWIRRRVESISFVDDTTVLRRVSVDLEIEGDALALGSLPTTRRLIPITMLRKRPLHCFDLRGPGGASVPILTTRENGRLAARVLRRLALAIANADAGEISARLTTIATAPEGEAVVASKELKDWLSGLQPNHALKPLADSTFGEICQQFAENFILAAVVETAPADRVVLKISYEEAAQQRTPTIMERLTETLGLGTREFKIDIPGVTASESYHVELRAPEGVTVNSAAVLTKGLAATTASLDSDFIPYPSSRRGSATINFHVRGDCTPDAELYVWLRLQRPGWLRSALYVTLTVAVLMSATAWRLPGFLARQVAGPGQGNSSLSTDIAALLMAVVALVLSYAVRAGEHPVTASTAVGARGAAVVAAVLPLAGAWLLAFGPTGHGLLVAWWALAVVSWVAFVLIAFAYRGPKSVTPR